jgi:hypothetical protein
MIAHASDDEPFGGPERSKPTSTRGPPQGSTTEPTGAPTRARPAPRRAPSSDEAREDGDADGADDTSTIVDVRRMPLAFVDRPLVTPKDVWVVVAQTGFGLLDEDSPVVPLVVGARFGVDGDLEVGLELLRLTMSPHPSTGLGQPLVHALYRLVGGPFELGVQGTATLPTASTHAVSLALPMVLHAGVLRVDLAAAIAAQGATKWTFGAEAPAEVTLGLGDRLRLSGGVHFTMPDFEQAAVLVRPSFRVGLAIPGGSDEDLDAPRGAVFDLGVRVTLPDVALRGQRPEDPAFGNYFAIALEGRFFVPRDRDDHRWDDL